MFLDRIKNKLKPVVRESTIGKIYKQSVGDMWYPVLILRWKIAEWLTRRKNVNLNGISFTLPCNNWITHFRWFLIKKKEPEVRFYIDNYVKDCDIFFDIGANIGIFSLYAGKKYSNLSLFCFEPEFTNLGILKENIIKNGLMKRTKIFGIGISDFVGLSQLHLQDITGGAAAHTESRENLKKTDEGFDVVWSEGISTMTIDHICEQIDEYPNCLKIDTDGNELKILSGAEKVLKHPNLRSLIIEIPRHSQKREMCKTILNDSGFSCTWSENSSHNEIWSKAK